MATPYESGELEELGTTQSVSAQEIPTHPKWRQAAMVLDSGRP